MLKSSCILRRPLKFDEIFKFCLKLLCRSLGVSFLNVHIWTLFAKIRFWKFKGFLKAFTEIRPTWNLVIYAGPAKRVARLAHHKAVTPLYVCCQLHISKGALIYIFCSCVLTIVKKSSHKTFVLDSKSPSTKYTRKFQNAFTRYNWRKLSFL